MKGTGYSNREENSKVLKRSGHKTKGGRDSEEIQIYSDPKREKQSPFTDEKDVQGKISQGLSQEASTFLSGRLEPPKGRTQMPPHQSRVPPVCPTSLTKMTTRSRMFQTLLR